MSFGFETTALEVVEGVDLSGKRAIVTGGASGIGIPTAEALVKAGAEVTLAVRDVTRASGSRPRSARPTSATWSWPSSTRSRRSPAAGTVRCTSSSTTRA